MREIKITNFGRLILPFLLFDLILLNLLSMNNQTRDVHLLNQYGRPTFLDHVLRNIRHKLTHLGSIISHYSRSIHCQLGKLE